MINKKQSFSFRFGIAGLLFLSILFSVSVPLTASAQPLGDTGFLASCRPLAASATGSVSLAACVNDIYILSLGLGGLLALLMIVLAGYRYMTASGNAQQVENAKDAFSSALIGLIVLFVGFVLLYVVNPQLTQLQDFNIDSKLPYPPTYAQ